MPRMALTTQESLWATTYLNRNWGLAQKSGVPSTSAVTYWVWKATLNLSEQAYSTPNRYSVVSWRSIRFGLNPALVRKSFRVKPLPKTNDDPSELLLLIASLTALLGFKPVL